MTSLPAPCPSRHPPICATDTEFSTPARAPRTWPSPRCVRARSSPSWLLKRRRRVKRALSTVVATELPAGWAPDGWRSW